MLARYVKLRMNQNVIIPQTVVFLIRCFILQSGEGLTDVVWNNFNHSEFVLVESMQINNY